MSNNQQNRRNKIWSVNSDVYHVKGCSAIARISQKNLKRGTAPDNFRPHDCVEDAEVQSSQRPAGESLSIGQSALDAQHSVNSGGQTQSINPTMSKASNQSTQLNPRQTQATQAHASHQHGPAAEAEYIKEPINPFCHCQPCRCTPPCTCGLKRSETTVHTHWDAAEQLLRHVVTDIYRPDIDELLGKYRALVTGDAQSTDHTSTQNQSNKVSEVIDKDAALAELDELSSRKQKVLQRYQQAEQSHHQHNANTTVRADAHKGHKIELRTTYELYIDGQLLNLHLGVMQDGQVHCHSIPNYSSASGIDVIKAVIDAFPDDYPPEQSQGE